ncbi:glycosyltransferase family 4 protein [Rhodococcus sp. BGS-1C]|uniref:glycosyltransferase family 4 protein n=1 Tax=unclassified Rhodococcus (in: high G+C Gram-positive bacteria) TaxID=192944 RepID=UPI0019D1EA20|nr:MULTISPECIES: glycosyltransferase family 4 protein [unclassified Rhodococcus (in: high G+C Gram-positive bacteria)]MCC8930949.1 glycosyltransferase family 4 protein [Rhodococcus sp. I2R]
MTGSEWFGDRSGGLNRYFESLFVAMHDLKGNDITAVAFGNPPSGGNSWGPAGKSALSRSSALKGSFKLPHGAILDRHFSLYGQSAGVGKSRVTTVTHFQGPWAGESKVAGHSKLSVAAKYAVERLRYSRTDQFIVLSERFKNLLVADYKVDESRVAVLAPGVDLSRFSAGPKGQSREVLCVRRLEKRMGIEYLIKAWPGVVHQHPGALLRIVGTGTDESRLRELATDMRLSEFIVFEGNVSDDRLVSLYETAAVTVVPSVALEGFGLIALESLATGTAPIVTDCGGLPDAVDGLDPSLVVQPYNSEDLAHRVSDALNGAVPDWKACRAHAETFSWQRVAENHFDLYSRIA